MTADAQIVLLDDLEQAINRLKAMKDKMPDVFEFEIAAYYFENLSMGTAIQRRRMMVTFEEFCSSIGYSIRHDWVRDSNTYRYSLARTKSLPPPTEQAIDI